MKNPKAHRHFTAMVTPLLANGEIDLDSYEGLLRRQEEVGNGVVLFGSTGEGLSFTDIEKQHVIKHVCGMGLTVPIMVGVTGFNLEQTQAWLSFCEQHPVDGYLMATPIYSKPGAKGQEAWFSALLDTVRRPCMLYNVPSRCGCPLSLAACKELAGHPNFWAIKEASGSIDAFINYRDALPHIVFYCGEDAVMPNLAAAGCEGLVSVVGNVWPTAAAQYVRRCVAGEFEGIQPLWYKACQAMFAASNPVPVKALLHDKGWIRTPNLRPPLSHLDLPSREPLRHFDDLIQTWESRMVLGANC